MPRFTTKFIFLPESLKTIRNKLGLSQRGLADYLGCTTATVSAWEQNKNTPQGPFIEQLIKLCHDRDIAVPKFFRSPDDEDNITVAIYQEQNNYRKHLKSQVLAEDLAAGVGSKRNYNFSAEVLGQPLSLTIQQTGVNLSVRLTDVAFFVVPHCTLILTFANDDKHIVPFVDIDPSYTIRTKESLKSIELIIKEE